MELRHADIDPKDIESREKSLFANWKKEYDNFISDGCADCVKYAAAPVRLLFVLKEVNGGENWDLRELLNEGARTQSWSTVARWVRNIFDLESDYTWADLKEQSDSDNARSKYLSQICAVNLKKSPGESVADTKRIEDAAQKDKEFLKEQLQMYQADIVILCGTREQYQIVMESKAHWQMTDRGIEYYIDGKGSVVISYSHPAARISPCLLHYGLIDAIKEIVNR